MWSGLRFILTRHRRFHAVLLIRFFNRKIERIGLVRHLVKRNKAEIDRLIHRMVCRLPTVPLPVVIGREQAFGMFRIPAEGAFLIREAAERHRTVQKRHTIRVIGKRVGGQSPS